ncbi:hypothetical protein HDV05_002578, partial [Chytridiales sp. JEL 0842]
MLAILHLVDLYIHYSNADSVPVFKHQLLYNIGGAVIYSFAGLMHHIEHFRSCIGSTALLFFWLFSIIANVITLRTEIMTALPISFPPTNVIFSGLTLLLSLVIFTLENLPKPRPYYSSVDSDEEEHEPSPELYANIFSRLTFHWMDGLMKTGFRKDLEMDDLWTLRRVDAAATNSNLFADKWNEELLKKNPSLLMAIAKAFGALFGIAAIFKAGQDLLSFIQPTFLRMIMEFAASWSPENKGKEQSLSRGFAIACLMLLSAVCQTTLLHQYFHICILLGMRIKAAVATAVYRKSLRLSPSARQKSTIGEIVNLMSIDAGRLG